MAVRGQEKHTSKKLKHKKSRNGESTIPKKKVFSDSKSGSVSDGQDESDTDLGIPVFKIPHNSKVASKLQTTAKEDTDSETDIDKPLKMTVAHKSVIRSQNVKSIPSPRQKSDTNEDSDEEPQSISLLQMHSIKISPERKSKQLSMNSPSKPDIKNSTANSAIKSKVMRRPNVPEMSSSESDSDSEVKNHHHPQHQSPQPQPESESGSEEEEEDEDETPAKTLLPKINSLTTAEPQPDSDSEEGEENHHHPQHHPPQPQPESESGSEEEEEDETPANKFPPKIHSLPTAEPQPESDSEEEEEEEEEEEDEQMEEKEESHNQNRNEQQQQLQTETALNPSVTIKQEINVNSDFSLTSDEDDPPSFQKLNSSPLLPSVESSSVHTQNFKANVFYANQLNDIAKFEEEHTRVSAPVIDIPKDSRVWVVQVPRSIEPTQLHRQHFPTKLKGNEVLNLPSGRWQILEQPYEATKSTLNCIVSTGNLSYGMRQFQPRGFWYLKRERTRIQKETADMPWKEEVTPLPIKELLKNNSAFSNAQHLKPSKKRVRDSDSNMPSKRLKVVVPEELNTSKNKSKKKEHHHHVGVDADNQFSLQGGGTERGKKRKHTSKVNEESPKKIRKKNNISVGEDKSYLEVGQSKSLDTNRTVNMVSEGDVSFSKKEKKSKHRKSFDNSLEIFSSPDEVTKVKLENTANDEWSESFSLHNLSESSTDRKQKRHKKSLIEQETVKDDNFMEAKQKESRETAKKEKKKKEKKLVSSSNYFGEESDQSIKKKEKRRSHQNEKSLEDADPKKKKLKHHDRLKGEVSSLDTKEQKAIDISVKKKKKKKQNHKDSDQPKVKQEDFWERETTPDFLKRLYLTQVTPEDC